MSPYPWRFRCPNGHTSLRINRQEGTFACRSCERKWPRSELVDMAEAT